MKFVGEVGKQYKPYILYILIFFLCLWVDLAINPLFILIHTILMNLKEPLQLLSSP